MQTKTCSNCKLKKSLDEFHKSSVYRDGYRGQCIECRRLKDREYYARPVGQRRVRPLLNVGGAAAKRAGPRYDKRYVRNARLKHRFGITADQFEEMSAAQNHKCALCEFPATRMPYKTLYVDHCHKTGVIRGLLCLHCNSMLGRMGDDVSGVTKMVEKIIGYVARGA